MEGKTIFWDMDGTLGFFEHFVDYSRIEDIPDDLRRFGHKRGIEELLEELNSRGFRQHVTTSGVRDYAEIALGVTDLRKYFQKVYAREDLCEDLGFWTVGPKNYHIPLKDLKIPFEKAGSDALIIGNSTNDVPYNIRDIVTIIDTDSWLRESELTRKMINMLLEKGEGDFNKGFHKLYAESKKIGPMYSHLSERGRLHLEDDVILRLELMEERHKYIQAPMFIVEKAKKYFNTEKQQ